MRSLIASSLLLASIASASAAPPSSCAGKFIGEWRHSGSGNRGSVLADGRALCSEHPACVQGTWTCSGNVLTYTNSLGSWNYTLAPDGRTMSTGSAVSTRIGPVPASARSRDISNNAANVTADVLGVDRTPSAAPQAAPVAPSKPATAAAAPTGPRADPEAEANAKEARKFFQAGLAAAKRGDWSAAEDDFSVARERFRSANMPNDAQTAADNARIAGNRRLRADAARFNGTPKAAAKPAAKTNNLSKEQCEQLEGIIFDKQRSALSYGSYSASSELADARRKLRKECQ
jgi:hypothetical protein